MKNLPFYSVIMLVLAIMFASCKKDTVTKTVTVIDTVAPVKTMVGFWRGDFAGPGVYPNQPFSVLFRSDSTLRIYEDGFSNIDTASAIASEGTYSLSGITLTMQFTYLNHYNLVATVDSATTFFQGTAGIAPGTSGDFVFIDYKVN
jgi:hypothetical protein